MYYPKSQIQADLYTNGGEFQLSNGGTEYVGYYFIAQGNRYFSGRNPNDKPNFSLSPYETADIPANREEENLPTSYYLIDDEYFWATDQSTTDGLTPPTTPTQISPLPTENNYEVGEFERFFLKKINQITYIEISQDEYFKYLNQEPNVSWRLYTAFKLPWEITGDRSKVFNVNKNTVSRTQSNLKLPGFSSYFREKYDQYFKYSPQENLYTSGKEFKLASNGRLYEGYYHFHPEKGPMVGRQHTKAAHDFLIPISGSNYQDITSKVEPRSKNYRKMGGGY